MNKPTRNRTKTIAISVLLSLVTLALVAALVTVATKHYKRQQHDGDASPIHPLDLDPPPHKEDEEPVGTNVVQGDLFSSGDQQQGDSIQEFQTDCLVTADGCTAFSAECCPGLICVPVNETTSVCSHFKGSICINTGMICSDAVFGVDCCDGGICTPEAGDTGRSRCVLPPAAAAAAETRAYTTAMQNPTPSPKPSLRPVH